MAPRSLSALWAHLLAMVFLLTTALLVGLPSGVAEEKKPVIPLLGPPPTFPLAPGQSLPPLPPMMPSGPRRFTFVIDAKTLVKDLLPTPPQTQVKLSALRNEDLAKVPEVIFGEPIPKNLGTEKALEQTALIIAKINHLNAAKTDGFMQAMIAERADLRGLPFRMGEDCRTDAVQAKLFSEISEIIQTELRQVANKAEVEQTVAEAFWGKMHERFMAYSKEVKVRQARCSQEQVDRALVAALMQIMAPESEPYRAGLARFLGTIQHVEAIRALAKLAIFSAEEPVRSAAVEGLRLRREKDYTDILMQGFRYPLPTVSKRAAEALIKLERKDVLPNLVDVLEQPDPCMPSRQEIEGKEVSVVRELVRVNHHRNCLMCHAPGNTPNVADGVLKVAVPLTTEPLQRPSDAYYQTPPLSPDIVVRVDMTYLRQDFSMMMPVSDAQPWPVMQRFDFLVRTRMVSTEEATAYRDQLEKRETGELPPNHRAALFALRELTGRDTEPTPQAWRRLLKLPQGPSGQARPMAQSTE